MRYIEHYRQVDKNYESSAKRARRKATAEKAKALEDQPHPVLKAAAKNLRSK